MQRRRAARALCATAAATYASAPPPPSPHLPTDGRLAKFGHVTDFKDLQERRAGNNTAPLLRTIEAWLRAERTAKQARGVTILETAERAALDELRGAAGNGYLSGRMNLESDGKILRA